jgi:hypothetical protein
MSVFVGEWWGCPPPRARRRVRTWTAPRFPRLPVEAHVLPRCRDDLSGANEEIEHRKGGRDVPATYANRMIARTPMSSE